MKANMKKKAKMIEKIIDLCKKANKNGKTIDLGDTWFSMAFKTEKELIEICNNLGIEIN